MVLLSVNPEIEVSYDSHGVVLEIEGVNDDGRNVVSGYGDTPAGTAVPW